MTASRTSLSLLLLAITTSNCILPHSVRHAAGVPAIAALGAMLAPRAPRTGGAAAAFAHQRVSTH